MQQRVSWICCHLGTKITMFSAHPLWVIGIPTKMVPDIHFLFINSRGPLHYYSIYINLPNYYFYNYSTLPLSNRTPIKCGSTIRLQHLQTRMFLHSHNFRSPLSGNQEVSCFGDGSNDGDAGELIHCVVLVPGPVYDVWLPCAMVHSIV